MKFPDRHHFQQNIKKKNKQFTIYKVCVLNYKYQHYQWYFEVYSYNFLIFTLI